MSDNESVFVWEVSLNWETSSALYNTRVSDYNPTDLNTYDEDVLTSQTDVVAYDYDYQYSATICGRHWYEPGGQGDMVIGYARCMVVVLPSYKCDQSREDYDNDFMGPSSSEAEETLACHEFGHSMGLAHIAPTVPDSCMRNPLINGNDQISGHDVAHINENYP